MAVPVVTAHKRGRDPGEAASKLFKRYAVVVVVIIAAVLVANFLPSAKKTVASTTNSSGGGTANPSGTSGAPGQGTAGTTVSGVKCGPGVRQVPWSHYAPICVPAWHGNNKGATAAGVTGSTITLTYREAASTELQAIYSIVPASVIGTNEQAIQTMQAYINVFNKQFELYGRKVVLKTFTGKGDFVSELNGQDQQGAAEDAVTAKGLGAFADSSGIDATPVYTQALANQHVVGLTIFGGPDQEFKQSSPYLYTTNTVCSKGNAQTEQLVERTLNTTKTSFAGDVALNGKKRVFGFIGTGTAQSQQCDAEVIADLKAKGISMALPPVSMSLSGTTLTEEANTAIGQFKAAGVTTILCSSCDFFTPIFLTKAADGQNYHPEWIETDFLDALTALQSPTQLSSVQGFGNQSPPKQSTEAYKAFQMGAPAGTQIIPSFSYVYEPLLMFFAAVQAAGPDLTPETFQQAFRSLPNSLPGGMYGNWGFTPTSFDPNSGYGVAHWSNTARSAIDGKPGAWLNCNNGQQYNFDGSPPQLPLGQELNCPAAGSTAASTPPTGNAAVKPPGT